MGGRATGFGTDSRGNAPGDERSGTWVRVAGPAAGANWGSLYTPRIGAEVVVQFIEGDIDRPVISGGLYGGTDARPFAAGIESGVNHPGVIAGLHSQRLDGDGFNQFALDDAPGQLRTRLHASHASAELGLGHLIQQSADSAQRGAWRGSGFEAGTAGWSSLRAAQGLLVSTTARAGTYGSAQSTQMENSGRGRALRSRLRIHCRAWRHHFLEVQSGLQKTYRCIGIRMTFASKYLCVIAAYTAAITPASADTHIQRCLEIIKRGQPVAVHSSYEDDDRNYISINDVEFGEYKSGGPFITMHEKTVKLSYYIFKMPDGSMRALAPHGIAMLRGSMYFKTIGRSRIMCIEAPLSGIGSSGSFQKYIALFEFESNKALDSKDGLSAAVVVDPHYKLMIRARIFSCRRRKLLMESS